MISMKEAPKKMFIIIYTTNLKRFCMISTKSSQKINARNISLHTFYPEKTKKKYITLEF